VASLEKKSHDVMQLKLQLPANDTLRYHAGQYVEFILRDGARRSYSMANAPHTQDMALAWSCTSATCLAGKFTDHVFGAMKEKEILRIEGPFGSFFLREDSDKPMVLLASGTGFAPIKASHRAHAAQGHHAPGHPVLGRAAAGRPVPGRLGESQAGRNAEPALRAGGV
jgi:CDP-4-dehydro-6-deoxyglucose reductase